MRRRRSPVSLTDAQLASLMQVASSIAVDQRHSFLLLISTKLKLSGARYHLSTDALLQKVLDDAVREMAA